MWFSPGPPVSSTNKAYHHDITELLLKVALNTIKQTNKHYSFWRIGSDSSVFDTFMLVNVTLDFKMLYGFLSINSIIFFRFRGKF